MKNLAKKETFQNNIRVYGLLYLAAKKKVTLFFLIATKIKALAIYYIVFWQRKERMFRGSIKIKTCLWRASSH
jgi:hypothetical protein